MDLLGKALKDPTCGSKSHGRLELCETFKPFFQTVEEQNACPMLAPLLNYERWDYVIGKLPGCNPVSPGPSDSAYSCSRFRKSARPARLGGEE